MKHFARGRATFGLRGGDSRASGAKFPRPRTQKLALNDSLFILFVGPRAARYASVRADMHDAGKDKATIVPSWCWPAFFFPQPWLFYRKQWILGLAAIILPVIAFNLMGRRSLVGWLVALVFGIFGRSFYVLSAERRIRTICGLGLSPEETRMRIARAGGVSPLAFTVSILAFCAFIAVQVAMALHAHPIRKAGSASAATSRDASPSARAGMRITQVTAATSGPCRRRG